MVIRRGLVAFAIAIVTPNLRAENELHGVRLHSCNLRSCAQLDTQESFRNSFQPNQIAFGPAHLELFKDAKGKIKNQVIDAGEGYLDIQDQVIVLRHLKNSTTTELIYNLRDGRIIRF